MFAPNSLADKKILITGGGSGLGFAMAKSFAQLGADIAICGRREEKLTEAAEELRAQGTTVYTHAVDVRDYDAVGEMVSASIEALGGLTSLVNNAAGNFYTASEDLPPKGFKAVVDIVLHGTFNCTQHLGRHWIAQQAPGTVLNIVTTYTQTGSAFVLPSACAKAGVYALTTSLAYEWATYGIRLNAIAPGPIPTEGAWKRLVPDADFETIYRERLPMKRFGTPEELANTATFLLSDLSSYINGSCVTMDGGEHLQGGEFNFLTQLMPREQLKAVFTKMRKGG